MSSSSEEATRVQATMEGRPTGRGSPGSSGTRVTVVYYLCRNGRHLEHPHLMELLLASPRLYLRDVLSRLDAVRGKGMAAIYSWSCKRRYKTGFVWHDVSEDDVLLPAQGSEYVLKGSLLHHSPPPALAPPPPPPEQQQQKKNVDTTITPKVQCVKPTSPTPEQESPLSQEGCWTTTSSWPPSPPAPAPAPAPMVEAPPALLQQQQQPQPQPQPVRSSFSSITGDGDEEAAHSSSSGNSSSPDNPTRGSSGSTPCSSGGASSPGSPPRLTPYNKHKPGHNSVAGHDAATQTDGIPPARREVQKDTSSMSGMAAAPTEDGHRGGSSSSGTGGRSGTLETLIRAEALGRRGAATKRILLEEEEEEDKEAVQSLGAKLKPANLLMRLVACGWTMSARHHPACGLMHKPHHVHVDLPPSSPVLSPLGALIMRPPQTVGDRVSESGGDCCGHCRGSFRQTAAAAGNGDESAKGMPTSSSCKHDGSTNFLHAHHDTSISSLLGPGLLFISTN
ncbi:protein SOSEKI 3-like isoform X2 [Phragmites australis]|uniref:protein SOSEKI 3-like isoform X2 n=1 Tax=Phragmites australis TaxID=29695 RepID=UPI002D7927E7|nr:protein SOSEKI 3-like isoform X2 [Phragmites australis]